MQETIDQIQNQIIEDFQWLPDWESKYEYIIDLGKKLPLIDPKYKTDQFLVKGCQSKVWLYCELQQGKVIYYADSDAVITKGIIALLIKVLSYQTPQDIAKANLYFIDKIGLSEHLSPTRANGLKSMILHMIRFAVQTANLSGEKGYG